MPPRSMTVADQKPGQSSRHGYRFQKASDVRQSLRNPNEATLVEALTALRNQLTIKPDEHVSADDERLLLVKSWLDIDQGAQDLFELWEKTNTRQLAQLSLVLAVLSSLVALLSTQYTYHAYATPIIRAILSSQWSSKLNSYLSTSHNELLLVTLKLYCNLSSFAGGRERRAILDAFPWELKSLPKLLHMRRRSKGEDNVDILARPDIRTLYALLLLSFVDATTSSAVKAAFLEQRRDNFLGIFKGIAQDAHTVVRCVLECCWTGIWCDPKVKRTAKIGLFNEQTVQQVLRLYERNVPEGEEQESVPADVAHHFLLAICTRPGTGICFKDRGWYPREDEDQLVAEPEEDGSRRQGARIYNKILAGVLKGLKVNEDARQQELALRILEACPELVAGYWHAAALTLEPRLSSKWIANIAFFGLVLSLPIPTASFLLPNSDLYRPTPPALTTILENVLPSVNTKVHLSRGLQAAPPLVQHCAALALSKCLAKLGAVTHALSAASAALEEDAEDGQWARRLREVQREAARRVPEFQVVVAFAQQKTGELAAATDEGALKRGALLAESAQRLLWLYHKHLPELVAETRFDVGKLLVGVQEGAEGAGPHPGLVALRQLHVLRLLKESEDFSWAGKSGSRGNLLILLRLYTKTNRHAMKAAVATLLRQTLSTTATFQHDPDEVDLWLRALPTTRRAPGAQAPDGTPLADEAEAVMALLDDCLQRCIKTPYRYLEELQSLCAGQEDASAMPSPMLVTLLEQVQAKVAGNLLPPSDVLAVVAYVRKLVREMAGKLPTLSVVEAVAGRMGALSFDQQYLGNDVHRAVLREVQLLQDCYLQLKNEIEVGEVGENAVVTTFLEQGTFDSIEAKEHAAHELTDALRLGVPDVNPEQFVPLLSALNGLPESVLDNLLDVIPPNSGVLCDSVEALTAWTGSPLNFSTLLLHVLAILDQTPEACDVLIRHFPITSVNNVKHALQLVDHRLAPKEPSKPVYAALIRLLGAVMKNVKSVAGTFMAEVKEFVLKMECMRSCCRTALHQPARTALHELLEQLIDLSSPTDIQLLAPFTSHWVHELSSTFHNLSDAQLHTALIYLPYTPPLQTLGLLSALSHHSPSPSLSVVVDAALTSMLSLAQPDELVPELPMLLRLRAVVPESVAWTTVFSRALEGRLPAFYTGRASEENSLQVLTETSAARWRARQTAPGHLDGVLGDEILEGDMWTGDVLERLVYAFPAVRPAIVEWLRSGKWRGMGTRHVVHVVSALVDSAATAFGEEDVDTLGGICEKILGEKWGSFEKEAREESVRCVKAAVDVYPALGSRLLSALERQVKKSGFSSSLCALAVHIDPTGPLGSSVIDKGLKWAADVLSEKTISAEDRGLLKQLQGAITRVDVNAGYAEGVVSVGIQNWLVDREVLGFVEKVTSRVSFKPVTVNRNIQSIVQHPKFQAVTHASTEEFADVRKAIIALLHRLFHLHPANTCQPSHVEPLLAIYGGTLTTPDRQLLSIFQLFERARKASISSLLSHWSPTADSSCSSALEAIQSLDPARAMKTCISFPQYYDGSLENSQALPDERVYDPVFVSLLFARMLAEGAPTTALAWVQMFRTNVVSLLIRALSSHVGEVRALAMAQVAGLYAALQDADMQEQTHVLHILDLLKNTYERNSPDAHPPRLAAYATLHLAHALRGVFYPAAFTYPLTARFLLQRPELDAGDVPLLYGALYAADDGWRRERAWIVRFLAEGMVGRREWRVLKRRHTWDLVASIFQSEERDLSLRRGVLEFLANLTCNKAAATSLVLGSALLSWIELQLRTVKPAEALAWAKILENVVAVVDLARLETATAGEWRAAVSRCLLRLLAESVCDRDVLVHVVRTVSRLGVLAPAPRELDALVAAATRQLSPLEKDAALPRPGVQVLEPSGTLHTSATLWQGCEAGPVALWGFCVESLWRAAMALDEPSAAWDALTSRLLVWRAVVGAERTAAGEWARREVVRCIGLQP